MNPCINCGGIHAERRRGLCSPCYQRQRYRDLAPLREEKRRRFLAATCRITVWSNNIDAKERRCNEPINMGGLCAKHAADKVRLGGAA